MQIQKKENEDDDIKRLIKTAVICIIFIVIEIIGGYLANSIAIISDAAHLFSDLFSFGISILCIYIAKKDPNGKYTFGYHRAEILGAMVSTVIIWVLTLFLLQEAYERLINPHNIDPNMMLITAVLGLFCNMIMIYILHSSPNGHHNCGFDHGKGIVKKHDCSNHKQNKTVQNYNRINNDIGLKSNTSSGEEILDSSNIFLENTNDLIEKHENEGHFEYNYF
jgi:zinc transporter 2